MTKRDDEIAELQRQVDALKAASAPPIDARAAAAAAAAWDDEMHQRRERRANGFQIAPEVLREMVAACGDAALADIVRTNQAPTGPTGMTPPQVGVRSGGGPVRVPGGGTGWREAVPLTPPPGIAQADKLMDAQDARDRQELMERQAREQALLKAAGERRRRK